MTIYTKVTRTGIVDDVITLTDVKRAINVLDNYEDDEIQSIIYVAFDMAEKYCHRIFTTASVVAERTDGVKSFFIPYGHNVNITRVLVDGTETTEYSFSEVSEKFTLETTLGYETLVVEYTCGYTEIPHAVDRGIKYLVANIRSSGQDFVAGMSVEEMPLRAVHILDGEKHHVV